MDASAGGDAPLPTPQKSVAIGKAIELVTKATEEDKKKNYEEAFRLYEHGVEYFIHAIKYDELKDSTCAAIRARAATYLDRSDKIKQFLRGKCMQKPFIDTDGELLWKEDFDDEEDLTNLLERLAIAEQPHVKWSDVAGLEDAKETLKEAFMMPLKFPHLFNSKRRPWSTVLLFGPSGTGKTLLANALATSMVGCGFILLSKCLEESDRLLKNLCMNKRAQKPTIIFIDEIDVLFNSESTRSTTMELLTYMQGPRIGRDGILILATTNEPWLLDNALLKRFEKKIYTPLPDNAERFQILKFCLGDTQHQLTEENLLELAMKTEGYSGSDISTLVQDALMQPVRKIKVATHYKKVSGPSRYDPDFIVDDLLTPCAPGSAGAIELSWEEIPENKLLEPVTTMSDMLRSLAQSKSTVNEYSLRRHERFREIYC